MVLALSVPRQSPNRTGCRQVWGKPLWRHNDPQQRSRGPGSGARFSRMPQLPVL